MILAGALVSRAMKHTGNSREVVRQQTAAGILEQVPGDLRGVSALNHNQLAQARQRRVDDLLVLVDALVALGALRLVQDEQGQGAARVSLPYIIPRTRRCSHRPIIP